MKKIWNFVTTIALILLLLLAVAMYVPKLFGIEPMIVLSGSMEPTYHVGSMLYVKDVKQDEIKEGTPITFYIDETTLVTHRVITVNDDQTYITQGDANEVADGAPVKYENIVGVPVLNIPQLGYLADKLSSTPGKIIYITIVIVVVILMYIGDFIWSDKKEGVEEKKDEDIKNE